MSPLQKGVGLVELQIGKTRSFMKETILICSNKHNYPINTPFNLSRYAVTQCLLSNRKHCTYPNYNATPNIPKKGIQSPSWISSQLM